MRHVTAEKIEKTDGNGRVFAAFFAEVFSVGTGFAAFFALFFFGFGRRRDFGFTFFFERIESFCQVVKLTQLTDGKANNALLFTVFDRDESAC